MIAYKRLQSKYKESDWIEATKSRDTNKSTSTTFNHTKNAINKATCKTREKIKEIKEYLLEDKGEHLEPTNDQCSLNLLMTKIPHRSNCHIVAAASCFPRVP
jgi:hypothetical protein